MKLSVHKPSIVTERGSTFSANQSINHYSSHLSELLYLLNEERELDDTSRMSIEANLFELTSYIPTPVPTHDNHHRLFYPNEQLSKILLDNYNSLLKFSSTYFNLSLSSHITKYMVELVYALKYWEVYHLLYLLPDLEYFLKLVQIEVIQTPFGPIVRPPENLMIESMEQGFDYPFPYPFYNYSYHSLDPTAKDRKYANINIKPYIDITLKNMQKPPNPKTVNPPYSVKEEYRDIDNSDYPIESDTKNDLTLNDVHEYKTRSTTRKSHQPSDDQFAKESYNDEVDSDEMGDDMDVDDKYNDQEEKHEYNQSIENENENFREHEYQEHEGETPSESPGADSFHRPESADQSQYEMKLLEGDNERILTEEELNKKNKSKSGVIHQCHLMDPHTMKACLKIFYGKNELLRHQEFVHATKKKIYKCIYCSRNGTKVQSYPRHDSLARHIRRKHGITGKENKMAVNYAKENVEIIDDPNKFPSSETANQFGKPLPRPQFLNSDFTIKSSYAGFLLFSTRDSNKHAPGSTSSNKSRITNNESLDTEPPDATVIYNESPEITSADKSPTVDNLSSHMSRENPPSPSTSPANPNVNVGTVNFNKPEASAIKENFQKFRLSNPAQRKYLFEAEKDPLPPKTLKTSMDATYLNSPDPDASQKSFSIEDMSEADLLDMDPYNLPPSVPNHEIPKLQSLILDLRNRRISSAPVNQNQS